MKGLITTYPFPLHVCQKDRGWISSWATSFGLSDVAMELYRITPTILKVETEQRRILDGVRGLVGVIQRTVNLPNIPISIKTETEGSKTIITVELKEGIFCDCSVQLEREEDELLTRILPSNPGKYFSLDIITRIIIFNIPVNEVEVEDSQDSKTLLIKEFLELTDAEETFLEEEPQGKWSLNKATFIRT